MGSPCPMSTARGSTVLPIPIARADDDYNELVGGPEKAYLRFADEGIDMGQRSLDLVRYCHERLDPAREVPYNFYPIGDRQLQRRGVHVRGRGAWGEEAKEGPGSPDVTGVVFMSGVQIFRNPNLKVFQDAKPAERVGNLLIYRGTFHLPLIWETTLTFRAVQFLLASRPDLDKAEAYFRQALQLNPNNFQTVLSLGNLMLRRGLREEAIRFYERAREQATEDAPMRDALTRQIARLSSNEPLDRIPLVRSTRWE